MADEALVLQQRLLDKLEEWRNSAEFGVSKYDNQKYKRAKGMLQATHPKVLTEILGITSVPNAGKDAMNLIRGMDLKTLSNLEIFRGMDDKVVGHHMSAFGAISGALDGQSPERRLELLNRAIDEGFITGMDPSGIGPIRTSIHKPIAHQGDFSGKKPGYKVPDFSNTDDLEDVWTSLKASLEQQQGSFYDARGHQSTQDLIAASRGVYGEDLITDLDLPMETRALATKAGDPIAKPVDSIITEFSGNPAEIEARSAALVPDLKAKDVDAIEQAREIIAQNKLANLRNGLNGVKRASRFVPLVGIGIGLGEAAQAAEQGNYVEAGAHVAGTAIGEIPVVGDAIVETIRGDGVANGEGGMERTQLEVQRAQNRRNNPTTVDKILSNPGNEAKYALGKLRDLIIGIGY